MPSPLPLRASRDELILSLSPLVLRIANQMYVDLPGFFDREDLITEAWIGAIRAVDRFKPIRDVKLTTFAYRYIRGHILDFFRMADRAKREERRRIKRKEAQAPIVVELCNALHSEDFSAMGLFKKFETGHDVRVIVGRSCLTERERESLGRYSELPLAHFAKKWGVHESRVSQICTGAVKKMRATL